MVFLEHPNIFKVGRSYDVDKRRQDISGGLFLTLKVVAVYKGAGEYESRVHDLLAPYRPQNKPCREWFEVSLEHINDIITATTNSNSAPLPNPPLAG